MNDELEATLKWLKACGDCDYIFEIENSKMLLDYITNLQEENERLKETNVYCNRTDCVGRIKDSKKYDSIYQEKEDYKSRIEKASNLIEPLVEWGECTINGKMLKSVYDILNGRSNE